MREWVSEASSKGVEKLRAVERSGAAAMSDGSEIISATQNPPTPCWLRPVLAFRHFAWSGGLIACWGYEDNSKL